MAFLGKVILAEGGISNESTIGKFRRNLPNPIPVVILALLAIDSSGQGRGLGRALVRDAAFPIDRAVDTIGIRSIIVHAISASAKNFYLALGFNESPIEPMTRMITLSDLRDWIAE